MLRDASDCLCCSVCCLAFVSRQRSSSARQRCTLALPSSDASAPSLGRSRDPSRRRRENVVSHGAVIGFPCRYRHPPRWIANPQHWQEQTDKKCQGAREIPCTSSNSAEHLTPSAPPPPPPTVPHPLTPSLTSSTSTNRLLPPLPDSHSRLLLPRSCASDPMIPEELYAECLVILQGGPFPV